MPRFDDDDAAEYRPLTGSFSSTSSIALLEATPKALSAGRRPKTSNIEIAVQDKTWLSLSEAAAYLGVSKKTVQRSQIPRSKVGRLPRFSRQAINEYLAQRQETPLDTQFIPAVPMIEIALNRSLGRRKDRMTRSKRERAMQLLKLLND